MVVEDEEFLFLNLNKRKVVLGQKHLSSKL